MKHMFWALLLATSCAEILEPGEPGDLQESEGLVIPGPVPIISMPYEFDVMTYNIRRREDLLATPDYVEFGPHEDAWQYRDSRVIAKIIDNAPDILGLQEVKNDQFEYLQTGLGLFGYANVKKGKNANNEYLPIFYNTDLFEAPDNSGEISLVPSDRKCSYVRLRHIPTGQRVWVFNVHYVAHSGNDSNRLESSKKIRAKMGDLGLAASSNIVLLGDFNANAASTALTRLTTQTTDPGYKLAFADSYKIAQPGGTISRADTSYGGSSTGWSFIHESNDRPGIEGCTSPWALGDARIDFVLLSSPVSVVASTIDVINNWIEPSKLTCAVPKGDNSNEGVNRPSDHDPVVSTVRIWHTPSA